MKGFGATSSNTYMPYANGNTRITRILRNGVDIPQAQWLQGMGTNVAAGNSDTISFYLSNAAINLNGTDILDLKVDISFCYSDVAVQTDPSQGAEYTQFGTYLPEVGISKTAAGNGWLINMSGYINCQRHWVTLTAYTSDGIQKTINWAPTMVDLDVSEAAIFQNYGAGFGTYYKVDGGNSGVIQTNEGTFNYYLASHSGSRTGTTSSDKGGMIGYFRYNSPTLKYVYASNASVEGLVDYHQNGYRDENGNILQNGSFSLTNYTTRSTNKAPQKYSQGFVGSSSLSTVTTHYINKATNAEIATAVTTSGYPTDAYIASANPTINGYLYSSADTAPSVFPAEGTNTSWNVYYIPVTAQPVVKGTENTSNPNPLTLVGNPITKDSIQSGYTSSGANVTVPNALQKDGDGNLYKAWTDGTGLKFNIRGNSAVIDVPYQKLSVIAVDKSTNEQINVNPGSITKVDASDSNKVDVNTPSGMQKDGTILYLPEASGENPYTPDSNGVLRVPFVKVGINARPVLSGTEDKTSPTVLELVSCNLVVASYDETKGNVTIPTGPYFVDKAGKIYQPTTDGKNLTIHFSGTTGMINVPFKELSIRAVDEKDAVIDGINPGTIKNINDKDNKLIDTNTSANVQKDSDGKYWIPKKAGDQTYKPDVDGVIDITFIPVTVTPVDEDGNKLDGVNPGGVKDTSEDKVIIDVPDGHQKGDDGNLYTPKPNQEDPVKPDDKGNVNIVFVKASIDAQPVLSGTENTDDFVKLDLDDVINKDSVASYDTKKGTVTMPSTPFVVDSDGNIYRPMTDGKDLQINYRENNTVAMLDVPFAKIKVIAVDKEDNEIHVNPGTIGGVNADDNSLIDVNTSSNVQKDDVGVYWVPIKAGLLSYKPVDGIIKIVFQKVNVRPVDPDDNVIPDVDPGPIKEVDPDDKDKVVVEIPPEPQEVPSGDIYTPVPDQDPSIKPDKDGNVDIVFIKSTIDAQAVLYGTQNTDDFVKLDLDDIINKDKITAHDTKVGTVTMPTTPFVVDKDGNIYRAMTDGKDLQINYRDNYSIAMLDVPFEKITIIAIDQLGNKLPEIDPGTMTGVDKADNTRVDVTTYNKDQQDLEGNTWRPMIPGMANYLPDEDGVIKVPFYQISTPSDNNPPVVNTTDDNDKNNTGDKGNTSGNGGNNGGNIISGKVFPKTSDTANVALFGTLGGVALLLAIALMLKKRKNK
ncbi:MAG: LPXTG cell wall anchor domain-containing protein [Lachnospiraceae bacterium]|jgi:LPXTG-motif cell wall-anchored protein|nr:LPXTG cell wall anchor domain-containing protein [Lachnospiraceae bacterium]